jgi:CRISPR/Cas system type I-B associated protein Csh2 (Cas7 group RAMP superfamily)
MMMDMDIASITEVGAMALLSVFTWKHWAHTEQLLSLHQVVVTQLLEIVESKLPNKTPHE